MVCLEIVFIVHHPHYLTMSIFHPDFLLRKSPRVHIHVKRYAIDEVPVKEDQVKFWLAKRFQEKNECVRPQTIRVSFLRFTCQGRTLNFPIYDKSTKLELTQLVILHLMDRNRNACSTQISSHFVHSTEMNLLAQPFSFLI